MLVERAIHSRPFICACALIALAAQCTGVASASGWPPVANDDSASVKRGSLVSVLDSGERSVLANDFDLERDPLTAVLTRSPKHGQIEFNSDGTFVYRHDGSFKDDEDEFRYRAYDGTRYSRAAKVEIEILQGEPVAPVITGQDEIVVDEDDAVEIRLGDLDVTDPDSDYPEDFSLDVMDGQNYTVFQSTVSPIANFNGRLTVPIRVFDGTAFSEIFDLLIDVTPINDQPFAVGDVADQEAIVGTPFSLSLAGSFDDDDAGDTLRFDASGLPGSGSLRIDPASGVLAGVPIEADARDDAYDVTVTARDTGGAEARQEFRLLVLPNDRSDLLLSANASRNPVIVGEQMAWEFRIENLGPADLEQGDFVGRWNTSGSTVTLSAPSGCSIQDNGTGQPSVNCMIPALPFGSSHVIVVEGTHDNDGDNAVFATALADDPTESNNTAMLSVQVADALSQGPAQVLDSAGAAFAVADVNSDGFDDVVVSGSDLLLHLNTGDRSIAPGGTRIDVGGSPVAVLDFDGDGNPDIAVGGESGGQTRIYPGFGDGSFGDPWLTGLIRGLPATSIAIADFGLDGRQRLALAGGFGIVLAEYSPAGTVDLRSISSIAAIDVDAADLFGDGAEALVAIDSASRVVEIFRFDGVAEFSPFATLNAGSASVVKSRDLDGDGYGDLIVATDGSDLAVPGTRVFWGSGDGTFEVGNLLGASVASDVATADFDGNGSIDIAVVNAAGVHQVYLGDRNRGFSLANEQIVSAAMRQGIAIDYNGDQSADLLLTGAGAAGVELHANNGLGRLGGGDREPPEITLLGETAIELVAGAAFTDPGATAFDDIDGDLTGAIVVSGTVNASEVGTYQVNYSVADRAANTASVIRTVRVVVNAGTGGGGGGTLSAIALLLLVATVCVCRMLALTAARPAAEQAGHLRRVAMRSERPECPGAGKADPPGFGPDP